MNNKTIHSFWISGPLSAINLLTIRSFQKHGHEFILYAYDLSITNECEVRDARLILPESEIYYYKRMLGGNPNFKFGGIAERLKAEMLYAIGGWHVDLDVTCLKPFDFDADYVLRPHAKGIVGNIIKAPAQSELARQYILETKTIDENNRIWEKGFMGLNRIARELQLEKYILRKELLGNDSSEYWEWFLKAGEQPDDSLYAIHWCNAMQKGYEAGSFMEKLRGEYGIS